MPPSLPTSPTKRKHHFIETHGTHPAKKSKLKETNVDRRDKIRDQQFQVIKASLVLSVPPMFAGNPKAGVEEMLDSMIMRYIPSLQGVVLSHSNLVFTTNTADIKDDCPYLVCSVYFDATIWNPCVGMAMKGKINLCSPDHISLIVHRTFNVSVPRYHIPTETWEFEYGSAENDPEFGPNVEHEERNDDDKGQEQRGDGGGRWIHRITGERLGDRDGYLGFTVIGLAVANEMLSLLGSIQQDPFSQKHGVYPPSTRKQGKETGGEATEAVSNAGSNSETYEDIFRQAEERGGGRSSKKKRRTPN